MKKKVNISKTVTKWFEDMNMEGLRILQEQSFEFFKLLVRIIYSMILEQQSGTESISPDAIALYNLNNIDLQFLWCNLAIDLKTEEKSNELLREIIVLVPLSIHYLRRLPVHRRARAEITGSTEGL